MTKELAELIENNLDIDGRYYCVLEEDLEGKMGFVAFMPHKFNAKHFANLIQESLDEHGTFKKHALLQ